MSQELNPKLAPIWERRSIRRYADRDIPEPVVRDLLLAAMAAPSAVAKDPWRFVVIRERSTLEKIAAVLPNGQMLKQAPLGLVVLGDLEAAHGKELSYLLQDCSAAIQNLLLAAHLLGLGACWLGIHPREERIAALTRLLALPPGILPISGVALGYPAESPPPRTRYREAYVHRERW